MKKCMILVLILLTFSKGHAFGDWISANTKTVDHICIFTVYKTITVPNVPAGDTFARAETSEDSTTIVFAHRPGFKLKIPDKAAFAGMFNAPTFGYDPYTVKSFLSPDKYINIRGAIGEDGTFYEIGQYDNPDIANTMITEVWIAKSGDRDHGTLIMKLRTEELGLSFIPQELLAKDQLLGLVSYCGMPGFNSLVILDPKDFVVRKYTNFSEYQLLSDQKTFWSKPPFTRVDERQSGFNSENLKATKEPLMPSLSSRYVFAANEVGSVAIIYPKNKNE